MLITMFLVFVVHVLLGVPLFMALLATAVAGFCFMDFSLLPQTLPQRFFAGINVFSLMAIPLFILAGNLLNATGMTNRLMDVARCLVGHFRGGMGHVNVVGSVFFAGVNGSAVADTSALGSLLVPAMRKDGYSTAFAAGLTAGSSLIGPIIPPSIFMILYSALTNTSVGDLFLAGVIPGLLLGVAFMLMNMAYALRHHLPKSERWAGWRALLRSMFYALPALVAPFIIVAGIVMGKVTPTESGALTAAYVALCGLLTRSLSLKGLWQAFADSARLTSAIFLIIAASAVVSWLLAYAQAPAQFAAWVAPFAQNMAEGLVLPYLDVPFQHAHPRVLKAMKRPASGERNIERIRAWREICPDLTIRSTFIAGFPGETEEEFQYLLDFLEEAQLDRVGCFAYSPVDGAEANELPGALPDEVREERAARFMEVQQAISEARLARKIGNTEPVLIDAIEHDPEEGWWRLVGRSRADAPEIDGQVYIDLDEAPASEALSPGHFVEVRIIDADEHDLYGELVALR